MVHRRKRIGRIGLFIYLLIYLRKTDANVVVPCFDPFNEQWLVAIQTPAGWLMDGKLAAFIVAVRLCGIVLQVTLHVVARPDLHDLTKQENWERRAVARLPSTPKSAFLIELDKMGRQARQCPVTGCCV
ncbi:hypothetical protein BKA60DRAFT_587031 [Fusarium oxysporum]|nr:hypothetical protein BKA60DRAFT_587031 [Fusarium oxysporum]